MITRKKYNTDLEHTIQLYYPSSFFSYRLLDTLEAHLDQYGLDPLLPDIAKRFPESITVSQAVATWKAIVFYQQHYEQDINF